MQKSSHIGWLMALGFLMAWSGLTAQPLKQDARLVSGVLKNGFKYYIYPNTASKEQTALQLFVNAGSLQENENQLGLAHFVEHMAFNGSKNYPKNEVITYLESLGVKFGADLNAHTSYDETVYKITLETKTEENLYKALDIVYDWAYNLSFDPEEIEKERGIIIEEWRTKQGASARMSDQTLPLIFYNSRYANRKPIGTLEILRSFSRPTILDFYNTWYRPDLMGIAIITNQDVKKTEKVVKKLFSKRKKNSKAPARERYALAIHKDTLVKIYTDKEATSIDFSYITKLPAMSALRTEQDLEKRLVRSSSNSLIQKRLEKIAQKQLHYKSSSISFSDLLLNNGLSIGGATLYDDNINRGIQEFLVEKERILKYGFNSSEIADYKKQVLSQMKRAEASESNLNTSMLLGQLKDHFFNGDVLMDKIDKRNKSYAIVEKLDSLTILNHIRSYFEEGNTVVLLSAPERVAKDLPTESELKTMFAVAKNAPLEKWQEKQNIPTQLLSKQPLAGKVVRKSTIAGINVEKWELSNGATLYIKPSTERRNHIQLTGFREGGFLALDTAQFVNGVFVKNVLAVSGAGEFDRHSLTKFLNGNTASASFIISSHREGLSASAYMKDAQTMFELLHLKWTDPRVDTAMFDVIKKKAIDAAKNKQYSVTSAYSDQISKAIGSDATESEELPADRIESQLTADGIVPVFKERFGSAKDFNFVIIGDFNMDTLQNFVEKYMASIPGGEYKAQQRVPNYSNVENKDILLYAGEADKATVNLFFQTTDYTYDYPQILLQDLAENIIKVKLRKNLREEQSGVYGVGMSISATSEPITLLRSRINFTCEPQRKDFLIEQAFVELNKIAKDPAYFEKELKDAKLAMLQDYNKQFDKNSYWSAELRNHIYFGFKSWDYFTKYNSMLDALTAKDVSHFVENKILKAKKIKAVLMPEKSKN
ncbi:MULTISPECIES: M16 family metallopeptidase [Sphingobacterium]|nr:MULTISPECIES: insulinase family protein [Sphingobacterium]